jgi:AmiR/NasT family two-component response regulator
MVLKILVAHENTDRVHELRSVLSNLGHEPVARDVRLAEVGRATLEETPDLAMVIVEEGSERALSLIARIVRESACPVIAILHVQDRAFINEAAKLGIFAYITDGHDPDELQGSIDIALRRFSEYHDLEGAFGRRAITERAKGILMERHSIGEREAFAMLRDHARRTNRKLIDVAEAINTGHLLLPGRKRQMSDSDQS